MRAVSTSRPAAGVLIAHPEMPRSLLLLVSLTFLNGCEFLDLQSSSHETLSEAVQSQAQSWIPSILPASARNIKETHNLDTNEQWLRFTFLDSDASQLLKSCPVVEVAVEQLPRRPLLSWWPSELQRSTKRIPSNFSIHQCSDGGRIAIPRGQSMAFYWR